MTDIVFGSVFLILLVVGLSALVIAARAVLMPEHPSTLTVNGQTTIATQTGQKLLSALGDNGLLIPSACAGAGTCGLCRVRITDGGPDSLPVEAAKFTRAELRDGMHLACQVVVRGDMALEVDDNLLGAETYDLTVASVGQLTPLIREVVLEMPVAMAETLRAGAFVQITAPPFALNYDDIEVPKAFEDAWHSLRPLTVATDTPVTRAYSLANRPEDTAARRLVMNIRLALPPPSVPDAPPGIVSSWLFSLRAGDKVQTTGPFGSFRVQPTEREMVFIGGGVGMAPLRAQIFEQLERLGTKRKISFWYGGRSKSDLFYADEFDALAARHPNFTWTVALSDPVPGDNWTGRTGFVHAVAFQDYLSDHPAPETCEYYLCGPPLMIRAVLSMLDDLGVDRDRIFNDDFGV
ncbi:MAG: NADH:ubiquinone reductase (Na(+)-transporting) subunit F [Rhodobacteraceae bacterium]|nr:NADH:ubiquinone reductase (Na(+)-transporting) subunit F [Paracoccaceae bacterium]